MGGPGETTVEGEDSGAGEGSAGWVVLGGANDGAPACAQPRRYWFLYAGWGREGASAVAP
jgi:hypothetical protein